MNIRLEYSPIEGKFKQAQATDKTDVAKGYRTLCCFVQAERAKRFTQAVQIKFPELNDHSKPYPLFTTMRDELQLFITEDVKLLEEQMNTTYKRRAALFSKK
ncbi:MAG: hypothetical protein WAQ28_05550 [Bacteroidia bacterium]|jgi:hypothetical protein